MIRSFFRILTFVGLAALAAATVIDATRSIGASSLQLTAARESWSAIAPASLATFDQWLSDETRPPALRVTLATALQWPTLSWLAGLIVLFAWLGRPKRRRRKSIS